VADLHFLLTPLLPVVSVIIAMASAPGPASAVTAEALGIEVFSDDAIKVAPATKPGEWLEQSPLLTILRALLAAGWIGYEFSRQPAVIAISNLNTHPTFARSAPARVEAWRGVKRAS